MWIICVACHHAVDTKVPRGAKLRCSNCGGGVVRTARKPRPHMFNGGQTPADQAKVLTYAGLVSIAKERGYKVGWAAMKYKAIYGKWPDGQLPEPQNPSGELVWWIRKLNRVYAAERRAKEVPSPAKPIDTLMTADDWDVKW